MARKKRAAAIAAAEKRKAQLAPPPPPQPSTSTSSTTKGGKSAPNTRSRRGKPKSPSRSPSPSPPPSLPPTRSRKQAQSAPPAVFKTPLLPQPGTSKGKAAATPSKSKAKAKPAPKPAGNAKNTKGKGKKKKESDEDDDDDEDYNDEASSKPTTSTAAAPKRASRKKPDTVIPDYLMAPSSRSRSCFADTSTNNKWNFGPMASLNRRRRDEIMQNYLPNNEGSATAAGRVKKNFRRATIKYDMDLIHPFVMCRLCDGYLVDATTIIDCMHTFCKSCLLLYFEDDENTCPTCGILIHGSHPAQYVTYDRAINDLVLKLVPNLEEQEKKNRLDFVNNMRRKLGIDYEAEAKAKEARREAERVKGTNRCYRGDPVLSHHRDDNQVVVKLIPGSSDLALPPRPFVRTSEMTSINSLKKYIALSLWDDQNRYSDLDIFCDNQLMGKDFSIRFVWMMKRRNQPKTIPLQLEYRNHAATA